MRITRAGWRRKRCRPPPLSLFWRVELYSPSAGKMTKTWSNLQRMQTIMHWAYLKCQREESNSLVQSARRFSQKSLTWPATWGYTHLAWGNIPVTSVVKPLLGKALWTDTQIRSTKKAKQCFLANFVRNSTSSPLSSVTMSKEITLLSEVISVRCAQKPFSSWTTWSITSGFTSASNPMCAGKCILTKLQS